MHKFMRSIGFSGYKNPDMKKLINDIIKTPEVMRVAKDSEGNELVEFSRTFFRNCGIAVIGYYDDENKFQTDYIFPFYNGTYLTTTEKVDIEKHAERESYSGICDEAHLGLTLIFSLNNIADFLSENQKAVSFEKISYRGAFLTALSNAGKILLPVEKQKMRTCKENYNQRAKLMAEAREGNQEAIDDLTFQDMSILNNIPDRVKNEDILTIVTSYFMPYGVESDQYSILADILEVSKAYNSITHEEIYQMRVCCNDLVFDLCINEKDLLGEPLPGRRFKGNVWVQGSVDIHL